MKFSALHLAMAALLAACASGPTRNYTLRGPDAAYSATQAASAREWMQKRRIYDYVSYGADTISFKFGSNEIRTMNYAAFEAFLTSRITGQTIASAQRADVLSSDSAVPSAIIYFDTDQGFAQWSGTSVLRGRWWIEDVPASEQAKMKRLGATPPQRVMCFQRVVTAGKDSWPQGLPSCTPAYEQLIGMHGKTAGDVFNLMTGNLPGALSSDYPKTWPDGQPLFPERAPHD